MAKERDPGRRVVLLEGNRIGWAASGRNGGFCDASLTHGEANGDKHLPDESARLHELGLENLQEISDTVTRYGIDCGFERTGTLNVATEDHQVAWLQAEKGKNPDVVFLDETAIRAEVGSPVYRAVSYTPASLAAPSSPRCRAPRQPRRPQLGESPSPSCRSVAMAGA